MASPAAGRVELEPLQRTIERRPSSDNMLAIREPSAFIDIRDRLLFAVPKKGRLHDQCIELLKNIGVSYTRKPRLDIALSTNLPLALVFLPAADIPRYIAESSVDLGITGEDMIAEHAVDVNRLMPLGFGKCRLCLQAPKVKGYSAPAELVGARIVTSFTNLTTKYFQGLDSVTRTRVTYVSGSVEAACGLGLADAIVDLVESGETMQAHGLSIVDVLMETQACLVCNKHTAFPQLVEKLHRRVQGVIAAKRYRMVTYNAERSKLDACRAITPGQKAPTLMPLEDPDWVAVQAMVPTDQVHEIMDGLTELGANSIFLTDIANTRATLR
eukprot:TRINITY_DN70384_c0_g1_i1.p1 TRINITY_DN70384_c0_g1~~TRINITY_DN70384_c0_g1_i1.p1  ORF type:complete len:328 (+),score=126.17 TRINITY_DN70384_c0_g1_i1:98-1081(+)